MGTLDAEAKLAVLNESVRALSDEIHHIRGDVVPLVQQFSKIAYLVTAHEHHMTGNGKKGMPERIEALETCVDEMKAPKKTSGLQVLIWSIMVGAVGLVTTICLTWSTNVNAKMENQYELNKIRQGQIAKLEEADRSYTENLNLIIKSIDELNKKMDFIINSRMNGR